MGVDDEVWAAFLALDEAFTAGDVEVIVDGFTDDEDLTLWRSALEEHAVGPDELRAFVTRMAGLPGSFTIEYGTHRVTADADGDVAWLNAEGTGTWDDGAGTVKRMPHRVTAVFRRVDGSWKCHTRNGSQPRVVKLDPGRSDAGTS